MQDELKTKWIEALRSGDYDQGHGMLRDLDDSYCCLGVLLDVSELGQWDEQAFGPLIYEIEDSDKDYPNPREELDLSKATLDKLGLDPKEQHHLVNLNDDDGADFNEIADWIEENV